MRLPSPAAHKTYYVNDQKLSNLTITEVEFGTSKLYNTIIQSQLKSIIRERKLNLFFNGITWRVSDLTVVICSLFITNIAN